MDILNSIATNNGLLGSLLVITILALIYVFSQLLRVYGLLEQAKKDHISDLKAINDARDGKEDKVTEVLTTILTIVQNLQSRNNGGK